MGEKYEVGTMGLNYADAGVDREKEMNAVDAIINMIKKTQSNSAIPGGHYAGGIVFGDNILSLATDGVGSKVILAQEMGKLDTIGIDCVAMNVNDLITIGSIPHAFVDYIAIRSPNKEVIQKIVKGLVEGCMQSEIPLVGGETAILPELIQGDMNSFDVAGTALGICHKNKIITGENITPGDKIIGIESSGVHSNGYTLARKIAKKIIDTDDIRNELLKPTRIYVKCIKELLNSDIPIHGMAHITGGGFTNLMRLGKFHYKLDSWEIPDIFKKLQKYGHVEDREMYRTFNMGIGYIVITPEAEKTMHILNKYFPSHIIGSIEDGNSVTINNLRVDK